MLGLLWGLGFVFLYRIPTLREVPDTLRTAQRPPRFSVIIPARNEAHNLPSLFASLEQQSITPDEIIVVDDDSTDGTAGVAAGYRARVIHPGPLPEGWLGKPHACFRGAQAASGENLVFLDADVRFEEEGLSRLLSTYAHLGGFLSVQPYHRMENAYERLSAFFAFILMSGIRAFTIFGRRLPPRGLFGPAIVCRRDDYFSIDGHRSVKQEILEDVELGRRAASAGYELHCFAGRGSLSFRMYPGGLRELTDGWTKNFGLGAASAGPVMVLVVSAWMAGAGVAIRLAVVGSLMATPSWLLLGFAAYSAYVIQIHWMQERIGNFGLTAAIGYPITLLFFVVVFLRSLRLMWFKQAVRWKSRDILVRHGK